MPTIYYIICAHCDARVPPDDGRSGADNAATRLVRNTTCTSTSIIRHGRPEGAAGADRRRELCGGERKGALRWRRKGSARGARQVRLR